MTLLLTYKIDSKKKSEFSIGFPLPLQSDKCLAHFFVVISFLLSIPFVACPSLRFSDRFILVLKWFHCQFYRRSQRSFHLFYRKSFQFPLFSVPSCPRGHCYKGDRKDSSDVWDSPCKTLSLSASMSANKWSSHSTCKLKIPYGERTC